MTLVFDTSPITSCLTGLWALLIHGLIWFWLLFLVEPSRPWPNFPRSKQEKIDRRKLLFNASLCCNSHLHLLNCLLNIGECLTKGRGERRIKFWLLMKRDMLHWPDGTWRGTECTSRSTDHQFYIPQKLVSDRSGRNQARPMTDTGDHKAEQSSCEDLWWRVA